ncbi:hypothetical protein RKD44_000128 [Streptomyces collinus]
MRFVVQTLVASRHSEPFEPRVDDPVQQRPVPLLLTCESGHQPVVGGPQLSLWGASKPVPTGVWGWGVAAAPGGRGVLWCSCVSWVGVWPRIAGWGSGPLRPWVEASRGGGGGDRQCPWWWRAPGTVGGAGGRRFAASAMTCHAGSGSSDVVAPVRLRAAAALRARPVSGSVRARPVGGWCGSGLPVRGFASGVPVCAAGRAGMPVRSATGIAGAFMTIGLPPERSCRACSTTVGRCPLLGEPVGECGPCDSGTDCQHLGLRHDDDLSECR